MLLILSMLGDLGLSWTCELEFAVKVNSQGSSRAFPARSEDPDRKQAEKMFS